MLHPVFICNYECRVFSLACFPLTDPCPSQEIPAAGGTGITLTREISCVELSWVILSEGLLCHTRGGTSRAAGLGEAGKKIFLRKKDVTTPTRQSAGFALGQAGQGCPRGNGRD